MLRNSLTSALFQMPKNALEDLKEVLECIPTVQVAAMREGINKWADAVDEDRSDFFASDWEKAKNWKTFSNGLFEPLFAACDEIGVADPVEYAGGMLGWLIRQEIVNRPDEWLFHNNPEARGHLEEAKHNIWGTFFWRTNRTSGGLETFLPAECVAD
jgi:hypothetical protein